MAFEFDSAKHAADVLRDELAADAVTISNSRALEIVAHQLGHPDWNTATARLDPRQAAELGHPVPVLRIQDQSSAYAFYVDYLGFIVQWEHRFEPELPLYSRLIRGAAAIDLSEHYGDGTPGTVVRIPVTDLDAFQDELIGKRNTHSRPGIDRDAPGGPTMTVIDPSSNKLRFFQSH